MPIYRQVPGRSPGGANPSNGQGGLKQVAQWTMME
jgi:hypothetical protein